MGPSSKPPPPDILMDHVPVLHPTLTEMDNFGEYLANAHDLVQRYGGVRIDPPPEWPRPQLRMTPDSRFFVRMQQLPGVPPPDLVTGDRRFNKKITFPDSKNTVTLRKYHTRARTFHEHVGLTLGFKTHRDPKLSRDPGCHSRTGYSSLDVRRGEAGRMPGDICASSENINRMDCCEVLDDVCGTVTNHVATNCILSALPAEDAEPHPAPSPSVEMAMTLPPHAVAASKDSANICPDVELDESLPRDERNITNTVSPPAAIPDDHAARNSATSDSNQNAPIYDTEDPSKERGNIPQIEHLKKDSLPEQIFEKVDCGRPQKRHFDSVDSHGGNPFDISSEQYEDVFWHAMACGVGGKPVEIPYGVDVEAEGAYDSSVMAYVKWNIDSKRQHPLQEDACPPTPSIASTAASRGPSNPKCHVGNISGFGLLRHLPRMPGINHSMYYIGHLFTRFCWHTEDAFLNSISYLHGESADKIWYVVPPEFAVVFEAYASQEIFGPEMQSTGESGNTLLASKTVLFDPRDVVRRGIPVNRIVHKPGTFVYTAPRAYHGGFNCGFNIAEAVNFALPSWFPQGRAASLCARAVPRQLCLPREFLLVREALALVNAARDKQSRFLVQENVQCLDQRRANDGTPAPVRSPRLIEDALVIANELRLVIAEGEHAIQKLAKETSCTIIEGLASEIVKQSSSSSDCATCAMRHSRHRAALGSEFGEDAGILCAICGHVCHFYVVTCASCTNGGYQARCPLHFSSGGPVCRKARHRPKVSRRYSPVFLYDLLGECEEVAGVEISAAEILNRYRGYLRHWSVVPRLSRAPRRASGVRLHLPLPDSFHTSRRESNNPTTCRRRGRPRLNVAERCGNANWTENDIAEISLKPRRKREQNGFDFRRKSDIKPDTVIPLPSDTANVCSVETHSNPREKSCNENNSSRKLKRQRKEKEKHGSRRKKRKEDDKSSSDAHHARRNDIRPLCEGENSHRVQVDISPAKVTKGSSFVDQGRSARDTGDISNLRQYRVYRGTSLSDGRSRAFIERQLSRRGTEMEATYNPGPKNCRDLCVEQGDVLRDQAECTSSKSQRNNDVQYAGANAVAGSSATEPCQSEVSGLTLHVNRNKSPCP